MERITNLRKFMKDPIKFLDSRFNMAPHLKLQELYIGPKRFVLIFDPDVSKEVLSKRSDVFVQNRTIFDRIKPITGADGLVQLNGSRSTEAREKLAAMFSPANMAKMKDQIQKNTEDYLNHLRPGERIDITELMTDLVLRNAFKIFLGVDIQDDASSMAKNFLELNSLCGERMLSPFLLPLMIPTRKNRRICFLRNKLRQDISKKLEQVTEDSVTVASLFKDDQS